MSIRLHLSCSSMLFRCISAGQIASISLKWNATLYSMKEQESNNKLFYFCLFPNWLAHIQFQQHRESKNTNSRAGRDAAVSITPLEASEQDLRRGFSYVAGASVIHNYNLTVWLFSFARIIYFYRSRRWKKFFASEVWNLFLCLFSSQTCTIMYWCD